jgi:hypothetical protein
VCLFITCLFQCVWVHVHFEYCLDQVWIKPLARVAQHPIVQSTQLHDAWQEASHFVYLLTKKKRMRSLHGASSNDRIARLPYTGIKN